MNVHETVIHQMIVESLLLQGPLRPPTMNQRQRHKAVKGPEKQNVKLFMKHDNRPNLLKKWWTKKQRQLLDYRLLALDRLPSRCPLSNPVLVISG